MHHRWTNVAGCLCFVCCGIEIDDDLSVDYSHGGGGAGLSPYGGTGLRDRVDNFGAVGPGWAVGNAGRREVVLAPRRALLHRLPGIVI